MKTKILITISILFITLSATSGVVKAEEITITGNGAESENTVKVDKPSESNVQQSNNAQISNNITTTTDTGDNSASNNTGGETNIQTGDAIQSTDIANDINTSVVDQTCCPTAEPTSSVNISGNGAKSENNASVQNTTQTTISVTQNATITNNIHQTANTGNNSANNNNGDVKIKTGNIISDLTINNNVNYSKVSVPADLSGEDNDVNIHGNGAESENNVNLKKNKNIEITQNNEALLTNEIKSIFNTGNNDALANVGKVDIKTGDILAITKIENNVNKNIVKIICCEEKEKIHKKEKPQPAAPAPSQPTVSHPSAPSQPHVHEGQVAGVTAHVLPVTGNNWIFFALLGNIIMLFLGAYLRLRSGNSPGAI
jgi:hypothetical protein